MLNKLVLPSLLFVSLLSSAKAHVTLVQKEAAVGAGYKAVFSVPHGCGGSATLRVRVRIPEGVIGVKPMPKPGWQIEIVKVKYDKPFNMFGHSITEGVQEVTWTGRLSDDNYDEFVVSTYLSDRLTPNQVLYFPVVQECESGVNRWIEIPQEGKAPSDYREPAPGLKLLPGQ